MYGIRRNLHQSQHRIRISSKISHQRSRIWWCSQRFRLQKRLNHGCHWYLIFRNRPMRARRKKRRRHRCWRLRFNDRLCFWWNPLINALISPIILSISSQNLWNLLKQNLILGKTWRQSSSNRRIQISWIIFNPRKSTHHFDLLLTLPWRHQRINRCWLKRIRSKTHRTRQILRRKHHLPHEPLWKIHHWRTPRRCWINR